MFWEGDCGFEYDGSLYRLQSSRELGQEREKGAPVLAIESIRASGCWKLTPIVSMVTIKHEIIIPYQAILSALLRDESKSVLL